MKLETSTRFCDSRSPWSITSPSRDHTAGLPLSVGLACPPPLPPFLFSLVFGDGRVDDTYLAPF